MIELTKLNGESFILNAGLVESIEATPDTIVRLTNGKRFIVREKVSEVVERAIEFERRIHYISIPQPGEVAADSADN
ncbi:flagellar FlbD family protein [bacterium]|nr:flagellar FlbD family protein [bacterium]